MIKTVEATGKTTDDAVAAALRSLWEINPDITEADVEVELLERARAGFLGIGSSNATVSYTHLDVYKRQAEFLLVEKTYSGQANYGLP